MMTREQYINSLKKRNLNLYLLGEKVENPLEHPIILPSLNSVAMTYFLAQQEEYAPLMTAVSSLTGERINRFTHLHQSREDLLDKVKMQRLLGQKTGACFQRCVGLDAANAVFSTTYEIDCALGTNYHARFRNYWTRVQREDLTVDGAMTDPKGDRSRAPSDQPDPDSFLRIVERRADGIVVTGAKAHQTGIVNSHEILVMPTLSLKPGDIDYAVCFSIPVDSPGITIIYGRQSSDTRKLEPGADIDLGNRNFGGHEALVIFDRVFIPNERIFLNGETQFCGMLVERFSGYHRQSYGGCKVGVGDVLIGAAALRSAV